MKELNYQKEMEEILSKVVLENLQTNKRPSLLLHACCGPCSSYVLELLASVFDITIYYYNPNIHPEQEYCRRLEELKKFLKKFPPALENKVKLVTDTYNPEEYFGAVGIEKEPELKNEPEKGERCRRCYSFRMKRSWDYACSNGFQWFTTTLSISPHKDSKIINQIGRNLENSAENSKVKTRFLYSDFKKKGGFLRSTELTDEYKMWRQDYCGCIYSKVNREIQKQERLKNDGMQHGNK